MENIAELVKNIQRERDLLNQAIAALAPLAGNEAIWLKESGTKDVESQIRQRAQELYEARGREEGHELDDWLRAEKEITGRKIHAVAA